MTKKLAPDQVTLLIQHRTKLKLREERNALSSFVLDPDLRGKAIEKMRESPHGKDLVDVSDDEAVSKMLDAPEAWIQLLASAVMVVNGKAKEISKPKTKADAKPDDK